MVASDIADILNLFHDGSVESVEWIEDSIRLRVSIGYLANRRDPDQNSFWLTLTGMADLEAIVWIEGVERVLSSPASVLQKGLSFHLTRIEDGRITLYADLTGSDDDLDFCRCTFRASNCFIEDEHGTSVGAVELRNVSYSYWNDFGRSSATRRADQLAEEFQLPETLPGGHCSIVRADADRVLKVPYQGEERTSGFQAALRMPEGLGPKVLWSDPDSSAILMERLHPGTKLSQANLPEEEAQAIFLDLALRFRDIGPAGFLTLEEYYQDRAGDPILQELLTTSPAPIPLHGDLHHENILLHGDQWRLIDPKGLVGDPAFEAVAFLRNPLDQLAGIPNLREFTERRAQSLAPALGTTPERILAWLRFDLAEQQAPGHPWTLLSEALA